MPGDASSEGAEKAQLTKPSPVGDSLPAAGPQALQDDRVAREAQAQRDAANVQLQAMLPTFDTRDWDNMEVTGVVLNPGQAAAGDGTSQAQAPENTRPEGADQSPANVPPTDQSSNIAPGDQPVTSIAPTDQQRVGDTPQASQPVQDTGQDPVTTYCDRLAQDLIGNPLENILTKKFIYNPDNKLVQFAQEHGGLPAAEATSEMTAIAPMISPVYLRRNENVEDLQKYVDSRGPDGVAQDMQNFLKQDPATMARQVLDFIASRGPDGLDLLRPRLTPTEGEKQWLQGAEKYFQELPEKFNDPQKRPEVLADGTLALYALMGASSLGGSLSKISIADTAETATSRFAASDAGAVKPQPTEAPSPATETASDQGAAGARDSSVESPPAQEPIDVAVSGDAKAVEPIVTEIAKELEKEGLLQQAADGSFVQAEENCYRVAASVASKFGYELSPLYSDQNKLILELKERLFYQDPEPPPSPVSLVVRQISGSQTHVTIEAYGTEFNYGATEGVDFSEPIGKVPLKQISPEQPPAPAVPENPGVEYRDLSTGQPMKPAASENPPVPPLSDGQDTTSTG